MNTLEANLRELIEKIDLELGILEIELWHDPDAPGESDYYIVDGEKVYTSEWFDNVSIRYNTMLTRWGTLMGIKEQLEKCLALESQRNFKHTRWAISFEDNESDGNLN